MLALPFSVCSGGDASPTNSRSTPPEGPENSPNQAGRGGGGATDTAFPTERLLVARFISALVSRPDASLSVYQVARFIESHNSSHTIHGAPSTPHSTEPLP
ncbi:hypothetical protein DAPPUDRAFT_258579 [Daphnia pulex]|uniref:Uncharacterized protein n=1 Tax=Daphnia pulex TaxID=6669 RepID=E9HFM7_DAPPU|nr:hypothetical protein DAPPUDRAFT_258579 [Daphnia pulex]|eukprot:EFX69477.1 hypothetical protein DAPPUDRAFT_258579 [Daphnia pulex]